MAIQYEAVDGIQMRGVPDHRCIQIREKRGSLAVWVAGIKVLLYYPSIMATDEDVGATIEDDWSTPPASFDWFFIFIIPPPTSFLNLFDTNLSYI